MLTLNFKLHDFLRLSWISHTMQAQWQDKLFNIAEQLKSQLLQIHSQLYPVVLHRIYPHELHKLEKDCDIFRQSTHVLELSECRLQKFYLNLAGDDRKISVLTGRLDNIQDTLQAIAHNDVTAYHQSLGTPPCCSRFLSGLKRRNIHETIWPMAQNGIMSDKHNITLKGHYATNPLLYPLGIYLLNHQACASNCGPSLSIADRVINIATEMGYAELFNTVKDILSWNYSWSTLHGIAELKTQLFKMIYNSQACAVKYQVDWLGNLELDTGIIGMSFPYHPPQKRIFTESAAYKRGLENKME